MKVGIVFDNQHRPETTGFYCLRALSRMVDVEHLLPHELPLISPGLFDLYLLVDDGLDYEIPESLRPRAAWAIDSHIDANRAALRFGDADHVFAAQKNGAEALSRRLGKNVRWLPLACDPEIHRPLDGVSKQSDIAFVGHIVGERRAHMIDLLKSRYSSFEVCQAYFDDMARVYSRAHIGFNCSVADDLNMRMFEIPAHGIPLVTNAIESNGLQQLFSSEHLLTYNDEEELLECVSKLLADPSLRQRIGADSMDHVRAHHTYAHRMDELLKCASPRTAVSFSKAADYFEFPRPDVQALIPDDARRILDIGCGAGALGASLKDQRDVHVTGIELSSSAAEKAKLRLDVVINAKVEEIREAELSPPFDCVILADVLEHLRTPEAILKQCREWLTEQGCVVISVPNSRHHSVVSGLIEGNWTYEKAGLLDEDHVRCFTRRELEKMLYRCGYSITERTLIAGSGHKEWVDRGRPGEVSVGNLQLSGLTERDAEEFYTYQFITHARRETRPRFGLTSIVIVTWNQLAYTRECVDSILARTDELVELVFVDNGSTDGTPDYLESIPDAVVIRNAENLGYAPAVNQGISASRGDNVVLLNNDCVVTTGWLHGLLEVLHDDPSNGLVGPVSNNVSGEQQIPVPYRDLASMDGFGWDCRENRQLTVTDRLVGFCLAFRKEVVERIGLLDEQFRIGCFEDDDLCRRAFEAGYRLVIAHHVFVHHYGSATFRGAGFDLGEILRENQARYDAKWASPSPSTHSSSDSPSTQHPTTASQPKIQQTYTSVELPDGTHLLQREVIMLSLCMIVRDNEDTITECLDSIYPWVDEIIIVDTGSEDQTPEICRRFGARMFEFPWCDDFSAARNVSVEPARGEWVFWMDSDDTITEEQGRRLRDLVYGQHDPDCLGYVMQVHCPSSKPGQMTIVDHVKVFRNLPELRFEHRIHEQILPAIRRQGGQVAFTDIHVVHSGSDQTPEVRARKLERDFRILKLDLEARPDHPFVLFNLGMTYEDAGQYGEAESHLRRCIEVSNSGESHLRKTYALLVNCQREQGRVEEGIQTATDALYEFEGDKELLFRRATLYQDLGRLEDAVADYRRVLEEDVDKTFQSIDPSICGYKAHHNLALTLLDLGDEETAISCWRMAVMECPEFAPGWLMLGKLLNAKGATEELNNLLAEMPDAPDVASAKAILEGYLHEQTGDFLKAQRVLETAWQQTGDSECLDQLARLLVENGMLEQSIPVLERLESVRPHDPAVLLNLGQALHQCGRTTDGIRKLEESYRLRPESAHNAHLLASIYKDVGDTDRAVVIASEALKRSPEDGGLSKLLQSLQSG